MSQTLLVAWPDDKLAGAVAQCCNVRGRPWRWLIPSTLAGTNATISGDVLRVDGEPVNAVLWRATPEADLSTDFSASDRVFADTEARLVLAGGAQPADGGHNTAARRGIVFRAKRLVGTGERRWRGIP